MSIEQKMTEMELVNAAYDIIYTNVECMCYDVVKVVSMPLLPKEKAEEYIRKISVFGEELLEELQQSLGGEPTPENERELQRQDALNKMLENFVYLRARYTEK